MKGTGRKKKAYNIILAVFIINLSLLMSGCIPGRNSKAEGNFLIYYPDKDNVKVAAMGYDMVRQDTDGMIEEAIKQLRLQPSDYELRAAIPEEVRVNSVVLTDGLLLLDFSTEYLRNAGRDEILRRAAIVRTLNQIGGVDEITFTVDGSVLNDSKGIPVGLMTADMFIDNAGDEINAYERTGLILYYADEEGTGLIKTSENVAYNSNISLEKLVTEHLISGPLSYGVYPVTAPEVKILSVITKDGVCYVNLSKEFLQKQGKLSDEVVLYSFINSLTELPNINKVQFMVDSETEISFGDHSYLNEAFERDLEIVDGAGNSGENK